MNNKNKISIIIPMYNAEEYIEKCITSVLNQYYKNIEIIVIDDKSQDRSKMICEKLQKIDNRIKLIALEKNMGVSNARNIGIENATGNFITFLDSDDYVEPDIYKILEKNITKYQTDLSICDILNKETDFNYNVEEKVDLINQKDFYYQILQNKGFKGYVFNKLFKTEIIKKNNIRFTTNIYICEDLLFVCEYAKYCNKVALSNKKLYHYEIKNAGAYSRQYDSKWETILEAYNKLIEIYKKQPRENQIFLLYTYVLVITEVLYKAKKANYYKKQEINKLKIKQKNFLKEVIKEKNFKKILKLKAIIYVFFPNMVQNLKRALKK